MSLSDLSSRLLVYLANCGEQPKTSLAAILLEEVLQERAEEIEELVELYAKELRRSPGELKQEWLAKDYSNAQTKKE